MRVDRRGFLALLGALPLMGWIKPKPIPWGLYNHGPCKVMSFPGVEERIAQYLRLGYEPLDWRTWAWACDRGWLHDGPYAPNITRPEPKSILAESVSRAGNANLPLIPCRHKEGICGGHPYWEVVEGHPFSALLPNGRRHEPRKGGTYGV